jgi:hypothetical protein
MRQEAALFKRDQRMHVMLPSDAGHGVTAGDSFYEHGAFNAKPAHDLTARRCKAAMLDKLRGENGGDATVKQFVDVFKFFDADGLGVVGVGAFVKGLRRLNVDPSLDTLSALVAKHETHPGSGVVDYRDMAKKVVPPSAQETEFNEKRNGARGERWGADGGDVLWAGYDRVRLEASLTKLQEPSVFDRGKAGDAGYVPMVGSLLELETLLKKVRPRISQIPKTVLTVVQSNYNCNHTHYEILTLFFYNHKILVCAPSNAAVDNLLERILTKTFVKGDGGSYSPSVIRVGAADAIVAPGVQNVTASSLVDLIVQMKPQGTRRAFPKS